MRRGSVAIVPLMIAIMLFFGFIWFLGGENDMLFQVNKVENLQHVQEELIIPAMQKGILLKHSNPAISAADLDAGVTLHVNEMMKKNNIQE